MTFRIALLNQEEDSVKSERHWGTAMVDESIWRSKGFASAPARETAKGGELIYRAYGGNSREISDFYFAPKDRRSHIAFSKFTRDDLEGELNVALYDNPISEIGVFKMTMDTVYLVGEVDQDFSAAKSIFFVGAGISALVQIVIEPPFDSKVTKVGSFKLAAGLYRPPTDGGRPNA